MRKRYSQREARRLEKLAYALETALDKQRKVWAQEYFGGVNIATITYDDANHSVPTAIRTARKLGHAVVVVGGDSGELRLMALPHPKPQS